MCHLRHLKRKKMIRNLIIIGLLVLAYIFNSNVAESIYPAAKTDYSEFLKYYDLRNQIYAVMFFLAFLFAFFNSRGGVKAIATFGVFVSFASVIDKVFYNFYQFKTTDWIIIGIGLITAIYVYYYERKNRRI